MKNILIITTIMILHLSVFGQKVRDVNIENYKLYIQENNEYVQTTNGLSVEVIPLHVGRMYEYPELFSWDLELMPSEWKINLKSFYGDGTEGKYFEYPLRAGENTLNAFRIKVTNQTGHILKMKDARIFLRVEGSDPIKPVTHFGDATLVDVTPENTSAFKMRTLLPKSVIDSDSESLVYAITQIWNEWEKSRKTGIISYVYPVGFPSQILYQNRKAFRLINDINVEILPDDSYSGILLFPHGLSENEINIRMYDFSTKTDAAGNVTEKSNFDFKFKLSKGTQYYDQNGHKWIQGDPPEKIQYYDKKLKQWFYGVPKTT